jgi:hypothetical protein
MEGTREKCRENDEKEGRGTRPRLPVPIVLIREQGRDPGGGGGRQHGRILTAPRGTGSPVRVVSVHARLAGQLRVAQAGRGARGAAGGGDD